MTKKLTFEEKLNQLENTIKELESGDLGLDESVKKYKEGIELAKSCHKELEEAEDLVVKIMKDDQLSDYETDAEGREDKDA